MSSHERRTRRGARSVVTTVVGWLFVAVLTVAAAGCVAKTQVRSVDAVLKKYDLKVEGEPVKLTVKVPADWKVPLGAYPEGLYWGLANEYSKDVGLDLTKLKGQTVEAWVYSLAGGLPGEGDQARFRYPSDVVVLLDQGKVAGAWVNFNRWGVGPSVRLRKLEDITGLTFEKWVEREGFFNDPGSNADLAKLNPAEVVAAFFEAINKGDKVRANACLSPRVMLNGLTVNLRPRVLYNPGFGENNSYTENILSGTLVSWRYYALDPSRGMVTGQNQPAGDSVGIEAQVFIRWRDATFNSPSGGPETRFIGLTRTAYGWKIEGFGTGP